MIARSLNPSLKYAIIVFHAAISIVAFLGGCGPAPSAPTLGTSTQQVPAELSPTSHVPLDDVAEQLGMRFTYRNGSESEQCTILESLGGGAGWLDYDRDGWPDLMATGGGGFRTQSTIFGLPAALFANLGGRRFVDVGDRARIVSNSLYSHGLAVADYDQDGFSDVLVTGYGTPELWKNLGDGTFHQVTPAAGVASDQWGSSAGWADLNQDGNLDLYLAHYVNWSFANHPFCQGTDAGDRDICPPRSFDPLPDCLYFSRGDGTFEDATSSSGLRPDGKGLGVLLADVEPDGDVDIYVANDTTDNFLYLNDGRGHFLEEGVARGVALDDAGIPNGSMGVVLCDYNQDGRPDIWVANYERESFALYRNEGRGYFLHVSQRLGISDLGGLFVGFGTACEDFDSDGDQDLVVANGHVIKYPDVSPRKQLPLFLEYEGKRFIRQPATSGSYFGDPHEGRGLATADFDADGDLDIAVSHVNEPLALLENRFHDQNHWLSLELIGTRSNRNAVGARVELHLGDKKLCRQIVGGGSYLSHNAQRIHFAIPSDSPSIKLVVNWPSGEMQSLDATALRGNLTLVEPLSESESEPRLYRLEVLQ